MDKKVAKFLKQAAIGAFVGAPFGYAFAHLFLLDDSPFGLPELHKPAAFVALLLFIMGFIMLAMSFSPRQVAEVYGGEWEAGEDYREDAVDVRAQGFVTLLAGIEMALLSLGGPTLLEAPALFLAGLGVLLIAQSWINVRIWKRGDEFLRRLLVEIGVLSFAIFQIGLFLWVVAVLFGAAPAPGVLDIYTAMMALYLVVSLVVGSRLALGRGRTGGMLAGRSA